MAKMLPNVGKKITKRNVTKYKRTLCLTQFSRKRRFEGRFDNFH